MWFQKLRSYRDPRTRSGISTPRGRSRRTEARGPSSSRWRTVPDVDGAPRPVLPGLETLHARWHHGHGRGTAAQAYTQTNLVSEHPEMATFTDPNLENPGVSRRVDHPVLGRRQRTASPRSTTAPACRRRSSSRSRHRDEACPPRPPRGSSSTTATERAISWSTAPDQGQFIFATEEARSPPGQRSGTTRRPDGRQLGLGGGLQGAGLGQTAPAASSTPPTSTTARSTCSTAPSSRSPRPGRDSPTAASRRVRPLRDREHRREPVRDLCQAGRRKARRRPRPGLRVRRCIRSQRQPAPARRDAGARSTRRGASPWPRPDSGDSATTCWSAISAMATSTPSDRCTGRFRSTASSATPGNPIVIDGLWGLKFGTKVGSPNTLFFTAGINGEKDGLFGSLTPA